MYCFMLSPWTTLRGQSTVTTIAQSESQWLDLRGFEDFAAWLEVKEVTLSGATHVTLTYQASPTKDDVLFTGVATAINLDTVVGSVVITPVLKANATVPLSRWLRYQLGVTGTPTAAWDASFRIWIAANIGATPRQLRARMPAPPIRQNGKSCSCDANKGGSQPLSPALTARTGAPTGITAGRPGMNPAMTRASAPLQMGMPGKGPLIT